MTKSLSEQFNEKLDELGHFGPFQVLRTMALENEQLVYLDQNISPISSVHNSLRMACLLTDDSLLRTNLCL